MMKKLLVIFLFATIMISGLCPAKSNAQVADPIDYNEVKLIGAGLSFLNYGYGFYGSRSLSVPPLTAYFEMGVHEDITVGPYIGFARWSYDYAGFGYDYGYSWTFFNVGGRGSYHLTSLLNEWFDSEIDPVKWDIYVTVLAGLEFRTFRYDDEVMDGLGYDNDVRLNLGPIAGARYYLNDNISLFLEGGYGTLGAFTVGVSSQF